MNKRSSRWRLIGRLLFWFPEVPIPSELDTDLGRPLITWAAGWTIRSIAAYVLVLLYLWLVSQNLTTELAVNAAQVFVGMATLVGAGIAILGVAKSFEPKRPLLQLRLVPDIPSFGRQSYHYDVVNAGNYEARRVQLVLWLADKPRLEQQDWRREGWELLDEDSAQDTEWDDDSPLAGLLKPPIVLNAYYRLQLDQDLPADGEVRTPSLEVPTVWASVSCMNSRQSATVGGLPSVGRQPQPEDFLAPWPQA
ncbi:MAG: hypothetical protein Kow0010_24700 [Dehalococcoidia bacterium]